MKISEIKDVTRKIEQGAWMGNLPNLPGVQVKVRGYGNSDYQRLRAEKSRGLTQAQFDDEALMWKMDGELIAEAVLEDWAGIDDAPYSREKALELLLDKDVAVFRSVVEWAASAVARHGKASLEEAAKN